MQLRKYLGVLSIREAGETYYTEVNEFWKFQKGNSIEIFLFCYFGKKAM